MRTASEFGLPERGESHKYPSRQRYRCYRHCLNIVRSRSRTGGGVIEIDAMIRVNWCGKGSDLGTYDRILIPSINVGSDDTHRSKDS